MKAAIGFLTVVGGPSAPSARALPWFPVVGMLVGSAVGASWWAASQVWPPAVAAAVAVAADLVVTGALHFDGLADSADGLLAPGVDRERRLEIMASPGMGAFALAAGAAVLLLRWASLSAQEPSVLLVAGLWGTSRAAMALVVARGRPARHGGLASAFGQPGMGRRSGRSGQAVRAGLGIGGLGAAAVLALGGRGAAGVLACGGVLVGVAAVVALGRRRLGGYTGDVIGAGAVVGETLGLLVGAARW